MNFMEGYSHPLLEPLSPSYSSVTIRRAFIVWMHCGQRNSFKDVCNYYHYLESLEETLPEDRRAKSRHHELNMFSHPPPTSPYLNEIFPKLYPQNTTDKSTKKVEATSTGSSVIKLDFYESSQRVTTTEILNTSHMIKKYCKSRMIHLERFLNEFKEHARKCQLNYTVNNVAFYIKRKMIEEELSMAENYTNSLKFLSLNFGDVIETEKPVSVCSGRKMNEDQLRFLASINNNSQKNFTILTRDKKEQMNLYWKDLTSNLPKLATRT